ncbi:LodA/GoxA family CTQ-dependent oxidase [Xanthomonas albilineans]|uniref:LodA/GoxA family CTQ-dependent oxidase n=1 Tax=Xanthomonas albilineans TaxID=29447 RepID=UPI000AD0F98C|nr:LodA/GoxA family CTQ-dependent oxidase [Xanthomonas albilineans]
MSISKAVFRIHPAFGIARVGNSEEFYLGPETMAGLPIPEGIDTGNPHVSGGLPIKPDTEAEVISSNDLRDRSGRMKRQAARFRIYHYPSGSSDNYPSGAGTEVVVGTKVGSKRVRDIVWTVHLANKKANAHVLNDELGIAVYESANAAQLRLRNAAEGSDPNNAARLKKLVIDPGPRAIRGTQSEGVHLDKATVASYADADTTIRPMPYYPKSFPDDGFGKLYTPTGKIETLGELRTDARGRLLVLPGFGRACSWLQPDGTPFPLLSGMIAPHEYGDVNADGWFDDTGDGPVSALIVFDDDSIAEVVPAWAITTDPSYAPQALNVVSLWDDIYDTWVRRMKLVPALFKNRFDSTFRPSFADHLQPIFRAPALQRWNSNLPQRAIAAHDAVGAISAHNAPTETIMNGLAYVRDPNPAAQSNIGAPFMPLAMGDVGKAFLTVTRTQYFFLSQWNRGEFEAEARIEFGPGEYLDRAVMVNCQGGSFAPGIEMTFVVRDPALYRADWQSSGCGPFRIRGRALDYASVQYGQPFLSVGYLPYQPGPDGIDPAPLEPGDLSKFMSIPWQTDYNACATFTADPNPDNSTTLYWAWPAQRPFTVHVATDVRDGKPGPQRYSIRGAGTTSDDLSNAGRFQNHIDMVNNWHRIGFVIQGSAIAGDIRYSPDMYLEVASQLDEPEIAPWPMNANSADT